MKTYLIIFEDNVVCKMYDERGTSHILPFTVSSRMYVLIAYIRALEDTQRLVSLPLKILHRAELFLL